MLKSYLKIKGKTNSEVLRELGFSRDEIVTMVSEILLYGGWKW